MFVNHYQRLTELADIENAVISAGNVEFPPIDVKGEVSFFMPFNMKWATVCLNMRQHNRYASAMIHISLRKYRISKRNTNSAKADEYYDDLNNSDGVHTVPEGEDETETVDGIEVIKNPKEGVQ